MKILKIIFILILFSNLIVSCTIDEIIEEQETSTTENKQATGDETEDIDETEKK